MKRYLKPQNFYITYLPFSLLLLLSFLPLEQYQAATSYTNAKEFYESTAVSGEKYHIDTINGTIYYATCGKAASPNSSLKYCTLGFDITLSGNGHSVSFSVQRAGGSMTEIDSSQSGSYIYSLYAIETQTLYRLASAADSDNAAYILSAPTIHVKMDAIMTTKSGNTINGSIKENVSGGLEEKAPVYHLKNASDLQAIKNIFTGHMFESYQNINTDLENHLLSIRYVPDGTDTISSTSSTKASVGTGYSISNKFLTQNETTYITKARVLETFSLLDPHAISLTKEGYHLTDGQEWITQARQTLSHSQELMPKDLVPEAGYKDQELILYANWQPNTYTVVYHANGGDGLLSSSQFTYDQTALLRECTLTREGYILSPGAEWNTKPDGTGINYASAQAVKNMTAADGGTITLYANWKPIALSIVADKQGGSGGTDCFYEQYTVGFYSNAACTSSLQTLSLPSKTGYCFQGYFSNLLGMGKLIVDSNGNLQINSYYYTDDGMIYAHYTPNNYTILFDKRGGRLGSDSASAAYDAPFPTADAPVKNGYTFKGYYTQVNGTGTMYYNEYMVSNQIYTFTQNLTLYAHWVDETIPDVVLKTNADTWTNQTITLTADGFDSGSGLKSLQIYEIADNGTLTLVSENLNCNGALQTSLSYVNPKEGIIRYKAVATDMAGNTAEAYNVVYYDVTPPQGEIAAASISGNSCSFNIHVTDIKTQ